MSEVKRLEELLANCLSPSDFHIAIFKRYSALMPDGPEEVLKYIDSVEFPIRILFFTDGHLKEFFCLSHTVKALLHHITKFQ